ncbi:MAG: BatA domain-containing protein, partial [Bdellovibrionales bacterium]|nr:BatA domain-containing protein [Bdellovibrionales bacterium]
MMELFGATYGLALPAMMLLAPLALAVLVYSYMRRGRGKPIVVASLMLLKQLKSVSAARRKFSPPLRFFFELLLLILLILALSAPFRLPHTKDLAVLIDNSLSMSATGLTVMPDQSFLEVGKETVKSYLSGLSGEFGVKVYVTSPKLTLLNPEDNSRQSAIRSLDAISFSFA